ncbi:MAG: hypothetical protein K2X29_06910, partial [Candidatus Obscuribacterales bacterium]|nr:hypothetical protein [Candidatus Obscuribacterales bacterium]
MELLTPGFFFLLTAYVVGGAVFFLFSRDRGFDRKSCGWLLLAGAGGGIIGAKVSRLLFALTSGTDPGTLLSHPDGRTIIGGVLFGWLAIELVKKKLKIKRSTGDGFALGLSVGEAIGRIG